MGDVWEEGYALKELNKRSAELLERKASPSSLSRFLRYKISFLIGGAGIA